MGTKVIGGTLKLTGEAEFNRAVSNCNKSLKEMQSAMKLVQAQTAGQANSYDSLKQKQEALSKVLDAQRAKQQELKKALDSAVTDNGKVGAAVEQTTAKYNKAKAELEKLKTSEDATNKEIEEQEKLVSTLSTKLKIQTQEYEKSENRVKNWQTKLNNADTEIVKTNRELQDNARLMQEADANTDKCAHSIDEYGRTVQRASTEVQQMQIALQRQTVANAVIQNVEKMAAAVKKLGNEILTVTNAYENGSAKVATIADLGAVPLAQLKDSMLQLSTETGKSIDEITEATYQAISASVDTADAVGFVKNATNLAKTGFLETADSVDVLTTIINAYKLSASDAESISDKLVQTQNKGKTTVNELSQSMGQVIPLAAAYNVNLDNLATSYVELTKNGIGTAEVGTMLKGMFSELAKEGTTVSDILKDRTGRSFGELMSDGKSLGDVLDVLYDSVEGNSEAFANLWSNVRARTGALSLAQTGAAAFNSELTAMANSTGNVSSALEKLATPSAVANKAMNALKNAGATLGDSLMASAAPALEAAANAAQDLAKMIDGLSPTLKTVIGIGGGAVALLATATPKILAFRNTIQSFKAIKTATDTIKQLKAEMDGVAAVTGTADKSIKGLFKALLSNPIAAAATAVGVLVGGMIALNKAFMDAAAASNPYHDALVDIEVRNKELQESLANTKNAFTDSFDGAESSAMMASNLKDQLNKLMATEEKDASAKAQIKTIVNELNNTIPNLGLAYDEVTDSLNLNNKEIEKSIQLAEKQAKAAAYQEAYTETLKKQADAELTYSRAQETVAKMTEGLTDAQRDMYAEMVRNGENLYQNAGLSAKLADQYGNAWTATEEVRRAFDDLNTAQDAYNETLGDSEYYGEKWTELLGELGEKADTVAETTDDFSASAYEAAAELADLDGSLEETAQAYADMEMAARESIESQVGLFDQLSTEYEESLADMNAALESQQQALDLYSANMETASDYVQALAETGNSSGIDFLQSIADMGIEGAGYLEQFVQAIEAENGTAEELLANFASAEEAKANYAASIADFESATQDTMAKVAAETEQGTKEAAKAAQDEKAFSDAGEKNTKAVADGTAGQKQAVVGAVESTISSAVSAAASRVGSFQTVGSQMAQGIGAGLYSQMGSVAATVGSMIDNIVATAKAKAKIQSPSKVMKDQVGKNLALGVIKGVKGEEKNAKKSAEDLMKLYVSAAKTRANDVKRANKLSETQEIAYWKEIAKHTKKGTTAYKSATAQVAKAKTTLNKDIAKLKTTLIKDTKSIYDTLKKEKKELDAAYKEAWTGRRDEIMGYFNLNEKTIIENSYSKETLKKILDDQVADLKEYNRVLDSLERKFTNEALIEEFRSMGVEELSTLKVFDSMTKTEQTAYQKQYQELQKLAKERALEENAELKKQTEAQKKELEAAAKKQLTALKNAYVKNLKSLGTVSTKQSKTIGKQIAAGLNSGFTGGMKSVKSSVNKQMATLMKQIKKQLKIKSPSQVFRDEIGDNMAKGIGVGFVDGMKDVSRKMQDAIPTSMDTQMAANASGANGANAQNGGFVIENRFYLGERDITDLITKKVVKKITSDQINKNLAKGAVAYV